MWMPPFNKMEKNKRKFHEIDLFYLRTYSIYTQSFFWFYDQKAF